MAVGAMHLLGIGYRHVPDDTDKFVTASDKIDKAGGRASKSVGGVEAQFGRIKGAAKVAATGIAAVAAGAVALAAVLGPAVVSAAQFEAGLVGVGKTANIEGGRLEALGEQIDALTRKLPNSAAELLEIAQSAGQLGVQGEPAILAFTETIARLGSASDLAGAEAASALARILNVTGEAADTVGTLASVIVGLGNNFAATESQIARHAGEIARATSVYKIGSAQSAAYAATLAAFGVQAELAGSAVGRSFRTIESAVKSGGEELDRLARVARVSGAELVEAFGRSPTEAFGLFLQGLRETIREGGNVAQALGTVKLKGEEVLKVLPVLAQEYDSLAKAEALAASETANATALTNESEKALETVTAQWALLRNDIASVGRAIGKELLPHVAEMIQSTRAWFAENQELLSSLGGLASDIATVVIPPLRTLASVIVNLFEVLARLGDLVTGRSLTGRLDEEIAEIIARTEGWRIESEALAKALETVNVAVLEQKEVEYTARLIDLAAGKAQAKNEALGYADALSLSQEGVNSTRQEMEAMRREMEKANGVVGEAEAEIRVLDRALSDVLVALDDVRGSEGAGNGGGLSGVGRAAELTAAQVSDLVVSWDDLTAAASSFNIWDQYGVILRGQRETVESLKEEFTALARSVELELHAQFQAGILTLEEYHQRLAQLPGDLSALGESIRNLPALEIEIKPPGAGGEFPFFTGEFDQADVALIKARESLGEFTAGLHELSFLVADMGPEGAMGATLLSAGAAVTEYAAAMKGVEKGSDAAKAAAGRLEHAISGLVAAMLVSIATPELAGGGTSAFGGQMGGTMAAEGAQIGQAMGGAWGAFAGMVIGSFIETGADDMLVQVRDAATGVEATIVEAEGGLADIAVRIANAVRGFFDNLQLQLGGMTLDTGEVDISIREELVTVVVDGYKRVFRSLDEALAFAAERVLAANANVEAIGEHMRTLFENLNPLNVSGSFEDLAGAVDLARRMDEGLSLSLRHLWDELERDMNLARQYGLDQERVLELHRERHELAKEEIRLSALQFVGGSSIAASYKAVLEQMDAYDDAIDREAAAMVARQKAIQDEIAAIEARGQGIGLEGGRFSAQDMARWRREAADANMTFEEFTRTLGDAEQAAIRDSEMLKRLEAEYKALAEQLGMLPDKFSEWFRQMIDDFAALEATGNVFKKLLSFQEKYGFNLIDNELLREEIARIEFEVSKIRLQMLLLEFIRQAELFKLTEAQVAQYQAWLDAIGDLEFPGFDPDAGRPRGGGQRRGAADEFRETLRDLERTTAGVSPRIQRFSDDVERLSELAETARAPMSRLSEAVRMMAQLALEDIAEPFAEAAQRATETGSESAFREAGEAAAAALADAAALAAHNPEAYDQARRAIEEGLAAQLELIGQEGLAGLGGITAQLAADTRATAAEIQFLRDNLEELGLTAAQVDLAIRERVMPSLFDIIEEQARRVGDERLAAQIARRRAEFDLVIARLQFEQAVVLLGLLGDGIDPSLRALIRRGRELFDLAAGERSAGSDPAVDAAALHQALRAMVRDGLSPALAGLIEATKRQREYRRQIEATTWSEERRAEALAILEADARRARADAVGQMFSELEALAQAAGVELPVEQARQWARIQFELARAQALVALQSAAMIEAFGELGVDIAELVGFVAGLEFTPGGGGGGGPDPFGDADLVARRAAIRSGIDPNASRDGGPSELDKLLEDLAKLGREAEISAMDDYAASIARVNDRFDDLVDRLAAAGAGHEHLAEAERLRLLELAQLQEEAYGRATEDIRSLLDELQGGDLSGRPAQDRLEEQMAAFEALAARGMAGDLDALDSAAGQGRAVLSLLDEIYGSGGAGTRRSAVEELLASLANVTGPGGGLPQLEHTRAFMTAPEGATSSNGIFGAEAPTGGLSEDAKALIAAEREENKMLRQTLTLLAKRAERTTADQHRESIATLQSLRARERGSESARG